MPGEIFQREDDESHRDTAGGKNLDPFHWRPLVGERAI
jgi:hypothetical protein